MYQTFVSVLIENNFPILTYYFAKILSILKAYISNLLQRSDPISQFPFLKCIFDSLTFKPNKQKSNGRKHIARNKAIHIIDLVGVLFEIPYYSDIKFRKLLLIAETL